MVHDAARPCITHQDLDKLCAITDIQGAILAKTGCRHHQKSLSKPAAD